MNNKFPFVTCSIPIFSEKSIEEVAGKISEKLFGGLQFSGKEKYIRDEYPAIFITNPILGFRIIVYGFGGNDGYILEIHPHSSTNKPVNAEYLELDFSEYLAHLLKGIEGIQIKLEN
jgi:hypothetical protein